MSSRVAQADGRHSPSRPDLPPPANSSVQRGPAGNPTVSRAVLISRALEVAGRLANDAAEVITATAGRGADPGSRHSPYDWVTDTDRTLERHTRRVLTSEFAGVPVLGEEYGGPDGFGPMPMPGSDGGPELLWVVDPVDGTANYVAGLPWCCYSLALLDADGPLVGVVADPYQAQIYAAARGRGLRANGSVVERPGSQEAAGVPADPLHAPVSLRPPAAPQPTGPLSGALICTELNSDTGWGPVARLVESCRDAHVGLRVLGSSALAVTQVALGRDAAAVLFHYQVWDVAGALALATEAGAEVRSLSGDPGPLPLGGLVVAEPGLADAVLALLD